MTQKMNQREKLLKRIVSQRINQLTQEAERAAMERRDELRSELQNDPNTDDSPRSSEFSHMPDLTEDFSGGASEDALTAATVRVT